MKTDLGNETDDLELIQGYLAGDNAAFTVLYGKYKSLLYNYLKKMLGGNHALADDLFQRTWIKAIDQLSRYEHRQLFSAWLIRIAHNLVIDEYRKNSRQSQVIAVSLDDEEDNHPEPAGNCDEPWRNMHRGELESAINDAVGKLAPEMREVFLMRREEVSFKEIARIQKCSINTALARMQYALRSLRKSLAEWKS